MSEQLIKILTDSGVAIAALVFIAVLFYRFFNIRMDIMKQQLLKEIKNKKYMISGTLEQNKENNSIHLSGEIVETTE